MANSMQTLQFVVLIITALLHIIFAGAIAKDTGRLAKQGIPTFLVSGITWAFATLVGGLWVVAIYWLVHRSSLTRIF
ncbi:MAG: hypothetical protein K2Q14_07605 [Gammaproteobacteria bacterium]|nr:hypothetical protein [Gammaproteobacteria bacterium]